MPAIEVYDTVVLKANRQLVGVVERTHNDSYDPLQDTLIIAHVDVDQAALAEFVTKGVPPKGYVFVSFAEEALGSSLVRESELSVLDRTFNLGDVVKKEGDQILGTVVSVAETYSVQPVWLNSYSLTDASSTPIALDELKSTNPHSCTLECPAPAISDVEYPLMQCIIHEIPGEELKRTEDILEADYVVQDDWLGIVEELELVVIIMLEDEGIVVVKNPDELYIPVEDSGRPLVSLPEYDDLARPDPLVALQGWSTTVPPSEFRCGQLVITNPRNLRQGRWLRGKFDPNAKAQGRILDVRTRAAEVRWLACNPFISEETFSIDRPASHTYPYENIDRFPRRSELRLNKRLSIYDHGRLPRATEDHTRPQDRGQLPAPHAHMPSEFRVGDHVKFRDPAGAAVKYQGARCENGVVHGRFDRVPSAAMFGFDVNELKVVYSRQEATVIWQDGVSSVHLSKTLTKFPLFEVELAPADLVVAREGMKQAPERTRSRIPDVDEVLSDFNEMKFFENPHDLLPAKVGIVQTVNSAERVAQVRWFSNAKPKARLMNFGHVLDGLSRFGKLSDAVEDVSLYEIMTFPALMRRLKDLVIIPPTSISAKTADVMKRISNRIPHHIGQASISQINPYGSEDLLAWLQGAAHNATHDSRRLQVIDTSHYQTHPSLDWMGEIVELGLDGTLTVRVNSGDVSKDVQLEHDQIICLIDEGAIGGVEINQDQDIMDVDSALSEDDPFDDDDTASTISEHVEYEGGKRLDDDSGDENWEDAADDSAEEDAISTASNMDAVEDRDPPITSEAYPRVTEGHFSNEALTKSGEQTPSTPIQDFSSLLRSSLPDSEPAMFSVLERDPPADQYQDLKQTFTTSPTFLKRITKEHRILSSSLPKNEIFVRTYENRLDLMRCLILGPSDTPYEFAPFLVDLHLGKNFPREPPIAHFHSWTSGLGRINPNLYEEGKICLSLLGTWPGKSDTEGWSEKATILQLLVSLQGLVFVRQPFYNEAGFEGYADGEAYKLEAQRYNEKAYVMARGFVKHVVGAPVQGLEDVLAWLYLPHDRSRGLLETVVRRAHRLIERSEQGSGVDGLVDGEGSRDDKTKVFLTPLSRGAIVMLKKTIRLLEGLMATLTGGDLAEPNKRSDVEMLTGPESNIHSE